MSFIGRSIVQKLITLFFVAVVSFLIIQLAPGEPSQIDPLNPKFTPDANSIILFGPGVIDETKENISSARNVARDIRSCSIRSGYLT